MLNEEYINEDYFRYIFEKKNFIKLFVPKTLDFFDKVVQRKYSKKKKKQGQFEESRTSPISVDWLLHQASTRSETLLY